MIHGGDFYGLEDEKKNQLMDFSANISPLGIPESVKTAMVLAMTQAVHYPDPKSRRLKGLLAKKHKVLQEQIICGNGAADIIYRLIFAVRPRKALVVHPNFVEYEEAMAVVDTELIDYPLNHKDFKIREDICDLITEDIDLIFICNPNNPTGAVYPREILEQIVQIARENELIIFSDEIYDRLVMDGYEHTSIASMAPDVFCVTFSGLSKSHMIAGFRIGWMILSGAKNRARGYIEGLNMLSSMRLCSNVPAQSIVQTALGGYQSVNEYIQPGGRVYEQRDYVYKALTNIPGITAVKPKAAFYIFPKIDTEKFNIHDDEQFALDFLHEKQVLLVPGKGFNWNRPDHFRVVYLPNVLQLEKAVTKLRDFLSTYRQQ